MVITTKRPEKKLPVDKLQEEHLHGPADEMMSVVENELKENEVVVVDEMPRYEWVIFRNQRDPGQIHEFHFSNHRHPFHMYKLIDGHKYQLHEDVIKNLESCRENIEKYRKNADGIPEIYVAGYKSYFVCERA